MSNTGKTALITGGGTGIGKAVALALADKGVNIAINYSRSENEVQKTCEEISAKGVKAFIFQADISQDQEVREMIKKTVDYFGGLDYLVNSAGTTEHMDAHNLEAVTYEHWNKIMNVNAWGTFIVCRASAAALKKVQGSIVNISSASGLTGKGSSAAYCASKAAVINITKYLSRILAPEVRVNCVAPGNVQTRWHIGREDNLVLDAQQTPLGRVCLPQDVADMVLPLLISAPMITGQTLLIDGGKNL